MGWFNKEENDPQKENSVRVQTPSDNIQIYGWAVESRYHYNGQWTNWYTHWNHKIYNGKEVAIDACAKMGTHMSNEYRVIPLFRMNDSQYRDHKLNRILPNKNSKTFEIKGWKLKEDFQYEINKYTKSTMVYKKGTVFIRLENGNIIKSGNTVDPTLLSPYVSIFLPDLVSKGLAEEIEIKDEKWLHPHLLKGLKSKLKIK